MLSPHLAAVGHRGLLFAAAFVTAFAVTALVARTPLGVRGEWLVNYVPNPVPAALAEPAILALLLLAVTWAGLRFSGHAVGRRLALGGLVLVGFAFVLCLGVAGPIGVGEPAYRTLFSAGIGSYLVEAQHVGPFPAGEEPPGGVAAPGPIDYLRHFDRRVARHPLDATSFRVAVHPPGMTLVVYGVERFWRGSAERRSWGARLFRSLGWPGVSDLLPPDRPATSDKLTSLVMPVRGALAVAVTALLVYVLTRDLLRLFEESEDRLSAGRLGVRPDRVESLQWSREARPDETGRGTHAPSPRGEEVEARDGRVSDTIFRPAFGAAALWLTVPSVLLHQPALDQATPLLALLIAWCWVRACARVLRTAYAAKPPQHRNAPAGSGAAPVCEPLRGGAVWAILAGAAAWVGFFFTLAMLVVLAVLAVASVLWLLSERKRSLTSGSPTPFRSSGALHKRTPALVFLTAAAAFVFISLVAWLALDYNIVAVLFQCARRNAEWNTGLGARSYWPWLAWNPVMFVLFFGGGASAVWLGGTISAARKRRAGNRGTACRGRGPKPVTTVLCCPMISGSGTWIPATAVLVVVLLLWLSGQNRGEVERLWSFVMAMALVAGTVGLEGHRPLRRHHWMILITLQLVLVFALRYRVDVQKVIENYQELIRSLAGSAAGGSGI